MKPQQNRNLYNGDCTFLFGDVYTPPDQPMTVGILDRYVDLLADSGVDTLVINTNGQVPWYPSRRMRHALTGYTRGDTEYVRGHYPPPDEGDFPPAVARQRYREMTRLLDRYLDLQEAGVDWVAALARRCAHRGLAAWGSLRMNDMHGASSWEKSFFNCDLQRDPAYRLSGRQVRPGAPPLRTRQPLNYALPEVRDYMLEQARELLEDYELDGLELDWLRCAFCCEPPASEEITEQITRWHRDVRDLCDARARRSGKPCYLGLRLPPRLGLLRAIGLDVAAMARRGVIDFVGFSNFWQTSWDLPYDELRAELGPDVAIYGVIEDAPNWLNVRTPDHSKTGYRLLSASELFIRGNAAGKLVMGADGLEWFNFFCTDEPSHQGFRGSKMAYDTEGFAAQRTACYPAMKGADQLDLLRGTEKQYTLATGEGAYLFPEWEYADQVPCVIEPGLRRAVRLSMAAEPPGSGLDLWIQVVVARNGERPLPGAVPGVSFNDSWPSFEGTPTDRLLAPCGEYTHHTDEHWAFNYRFPLAAIRDGWNRVLIWNEGPRETTPPLRLTSLELALLRGQPS